MSWAPVMWFFSALTGTMFGSIFLMGTTWQNPPEVAKDPTKRKCRERHETGRFCKIQDLIWLILQKQAVQSNGDQSSQALNHQTCGVPILRQTHKNYLCSNTPNCKPPIWDGKPLIWDGWNADAAHSMVKIRILYWLYHIGIFNLLSYILFIIDSRMTFFSNTLRLPKSSENHTQGSNEILQLGKPKSHSWRPLTGNLALFRPLCVSTAYKVGCCLWKMNIFVDLCVGAVTTSKQQFQFQTPWSINDHPSTPLVPFYKPAMSAPHFREQDLAQQRLRALCFFSWPWDQDHQAHQGRTLEAHRDGTNVSSSFHQNQMDL